MIVIGKNRAGRAVCVPDEHLDRHTLVFGASGGGKSYFNFVVISEMLKRKCSLVVIDPDRPTVRRIRGACAAAHIPPKHVVTIDPSDREAIPAFNPSRSGDAPERVVAQLLSVIDQAMGTENLVQTRSFLLHALTLVVWHGATLLDVPKLLRDEAHREQILRSPLFHPRDDQYDYSVTYFRDEYGAIPATSRNTSLNAIGNRFHELLGSHFFSRLFGQTESCISFPQLFSEQRVVLAILNPLQIGDSKVQLLGGMLAYLVMAAATEYGENANRNVVLCLDEMGSQSRFLSTALENVANMARKYRLRLVVATQHPGKLPPAFRADIDTSSKVKAFFGTSGSAAEATARFLESHTEQEEPEAEGERITPYYGKLLAGRIGEYGLFQVAADWDPPTKPLYVDPYNPGVSLKRFCSFSAHVEPPLYLQDGRRAIDALRGLPEGVAYLQWRGRQGYLVIDPPKALPPPPKPNWLLTLRKLEPGQAVMMIGEDPPEPVDITHITPPADAPAEYVEASRSACLPKEKPPVNRAATPAQKERPKADYFIR